MEGLNNKEVHKKEYEEVRNRVLEKEIINLIEASVTEKRKRNDNLRYNVKIPRKNYNIIKKYIEINDHLGYNH